MKILWSMVLMMVALHAASIVTEKQLAREWAQMTPYQKNALLKDFELAFKDDLGWTLMSINWQESQGCKYRMNLVPNRNEMVFGCHHNLLKIYMKRNKIKNTSFNRVLSAQDLIENQEISAQAAMDELLYWKKRRNGKWRAMVASYFSGNKWSDNGGPEYATNIYKRITFLKKNFYRAKMAEAKLTHQQKFELVAQLD